MTTPQDPSKSATQNPASKPQGGPERQRDDRDQNQIQRDKAQQQKPGDRAIPASGGQRGTSSEQGGQSGRTGDQSGSGATNRSDSARMPTHGSNQEANRGKAQGSDDDTADTGDVVDSSKRSNSGANEPKKPSDTQNKNENRPR